MCLVTALTGCGGSSQSSPSASATATSAPAVTPPSKAAIAAAPTTVTISCTTKGTTVSKPIVTTSSTGVSLAVVNRTGKQRVVGYQITLASGGPAVLGSFEPTTSTKPAIYDLPTGRMDLRCGTSANTGLDDDVSLAIVDRKSYYNSVNTAQALGCTPKKLSTERIFPARATRADALTLMAERLPTPGKYTVTSGPGYKAANVTTHLVLRNGRGYGVATVTLLPNLSYRPAVVATC